MNRLKAASSAASAASKPSRGVTASTGASAYSASVPSGQSASIDSRSRAGGEADQDLRGIVDVLARDEKRGHDDALALLETPDVAPDRLDRPDRVRAEW